MLLVTFNNKNQIIRMFFLFLFRFFLSINQYLIEVVIDEPTTRSNDKPPRATILKGYKYPEKEIKNVAFHKLSNLASSLYDKSSLMERPWNIVRLLSGSSIP